MNRAQQQTYHRREHHQPHQQREFHTGSRWPSDAAATDSDGTIAKVEFFQGTTKLGEDLTSPYSFWHGRVCRPEVILWRPSDWQPKCSDNINGDCNNSEQRQLYHRPWVFLAG